MLFNPLTADNVFKCHQTFNGKNREFANFLVTFGRSPIAIYALTWRLFILNFLLNRTRISVWYTDEEKVAKLAISIEMVKSS